MGRLKAQENADRAEIRLAIRSFTVSVNCQIRGLTSIRKGQGKDHIPFLVNTDSITASENVSGGVQFKNRRSLRKAIFTKPEGFQSGRVQHFPRGLTFANPEGSQSGGVSILLIWRGPIFANVEGYCFCQPGGVLFC